MNYIGSKLSLLPFLEQAISGAVDSPLHGMTFCDIFAGTGAVARAFKSKADTVIANDCELYSYVLLRNYIGNSSELAGKEGYIAQLNSLSPQHGFIFENYSIGGSAGRMYFSATNGAKIDATRQCIEQWHAKGDVSDDKYYFLLCSLLESADKVANTASVYGAYLKKLKASAAKEMVIAPAEYEITNSQGRVYMCDANALIRRIDGDILYLDPPYNQRQYGANYHLLNTIADYKPFAPRGVTGMRSYSRSRYCMRREVGAALDDLVKNAKFRYIFLSYNNEGLLPPETIREIMSRYGRYTLTQQSYRRFKADTDAHRQHAADSTTEYLHILRK